MARTSNSTSIVNKYVESICRRNRKKKAKPNNYKNIYLTGGKSLLLFYENLSLLLKKKNKNLNFFLTDERLNAKLAKDVNYNVVVKSFLKYTKKIFKYPLKYNLNQSHKINFFFKQTKHRPDLIILSLGKEGHVASIFELQKILKEFKFFNLSEPVNYKFKRIGINIKYINLAKKVIIFVTGIKKSIELKKLLKNYSNSTIKKFKRISWVMDQSAYKSLNFKSIRNSKL